MQTGTVDSLDCENMHINQGWISGFFRPLVFYGLKKQNKNNFTRIMVSSFFKYFYISHFF